MKIMKYLNKINAIESIDTRVLTKSRIFMIKEECQNPDQFFEKK